MRRSAGFTFAELLVVMGILGVLFIFATVRLLGAQHGPQLTTAVDTLVGDLKGQQLRAMSGDSGGTGNTLNYGIYFSSSQYTLFRGTVFSPSDPANFTVTLAPPIQLSTTLPGSTIVFAKGSGQVVNFSNGANTLTVQNTESNQQKTITINQLGVVTAAQ